MQVDGPYVKANPHDGGTVLVFRNGEGQPMIQVLGSSRESPWPDYVDITTGQMIPVTTSVSQGDWVYVVGGNHLHLEYRNGLENPLKYVVHDYTGNPLITPRCKYIDSAGLAQNFTGNTIYNFGDRPAILQAGVDVRANKNLNSVEIFVRSVRPTGSDYVSMNKWVYEPATTPGLVYTTTGKGRPIYKKATDQEIATATDEGVYPFKDSVSLDFFKYKWDTKEKKSGGGTASINDEAKWSNGLYSIKMEAMDIIGYPDVGSKSEEEKIVDNFKPYLKRMEIRQEDKVRYTDEWIWNETEQVLERKHANHKDRQTDTVKAGKKIYVTLTFSEPMEEASAGIGTPDNALEKLTEDDKTWGAEISVGGTPEVWGPQYVVVSGKDLAGNDIDGDPPTVAYRDIDNS